MGWNKRVIAYPDMRPDTESMLRERYQDDVQALASITGRDLTHWLPAARQRE